MNFADTMRNETTITRTENGAFAYNTTEDALLDFFSIAGAMRTRSVSEIADKFAAAYAEDPLLATKAMFYTGDIRLGGLGERRTFRICLHWLAKYHPEVVIKNINLIPAFNRWDSVFELIGTKAEKAMWSMINEQIHKDMATMVWDKPISLLAKWLPSENASSNKTKALAAKVRKNIGMSSKEYRKMLSAMRKHLKVTEVAMSANEWGDIEYSAVPSKAMYNYNNAFKRHDGVRFNDYVNALNIGEAKVNSSVLFPYELVHQIRTNKGNDITEAQWKALPNYVTKDSNILVMADVSGSMYGRPIETSIGLATYFAERNTGAYHNLYMSFSERPHFISLDGKKSLKSKVEYAWTKDVGYSTNLAGAFDYVLNHAMTHNVSPDEMPAAIVVISDMEIDPYFCENSYRSTDFVVAMERKYNSFGYKLPKLILWNVDSHKDTFLTKNKNVLLVSGQSAATFKHLMQDLSGVSAYELMLKVLNSDVYSNVVMP